MNRNALSSLRPPAITVRLFVPLAVVTTVLAVLSFAIGAGEVGFADIARWIAGGGANPQSAMVIEELRLPRTLAALALGAGLACSGVLLQTITRNPLAESGLLGVNSGAALAVVMSLVLFSGQTLSTQLYWALGGSFIGSVFVLACARAGRGEASPLRLVLAGLAFGATSQGLMAFLLISDQAGLDQYRFWVLGSLARVTPERLAIALPVLAVGFASIFFLARPLSALTLGEDLARTLGFRPGRVRLLAACSVALLSGAAVAVAGPLAFLGLAAPLIARALGGIELKRQLVYAALIGAALLLAADLAARLVIRPFEAPVSALLALIGAPALIWMVRRDAELNLGRGGVDL